MVKENKDISRYKRKKNTLINHIIIKTFMILKNNITILKILIHFGTHLNVYKIKLNSTNIISKVIILYNVRFLY